MEIDAYDEWCEQTDQMVYTTCHRSCETCTTVCPGPHVPAKIVVTPASGGPAADRSGSRQHDNDGRTAGEMHRG